MMKHKSLLKTIISIVLSIAVVMGAVPMPFVPGGMVAHVTDITLSGNNNYTARDGDVLTVSTSGPVTITAVYRFAEDPDTAPKRCVFIRDF